MSARVLVADDIPGSRRLLAALLTRAGYVVEAVSDGHEALDAVARERPDLILLDIMMPNLDGFETCRRVKSDSALRLIPVVLITALEGSDEKVRGLDAGADDFISKPFNQHELIARVRSLVRIKRYTDELDSADSVIASLALTIEARDPCTDGHCQRLATYATALGESLGLGADDLISLRRGGYLHDIGKVGVSDTLLLKPGPLTPNEFEQMKTHTVIGDRLCGALASLRRIRPIVRSHHERLDGSGYPDGLRGDGIPLVAQIMGIVDVFDALTTDRPYKSAWSASRACEELARDVDRGWRGADLVAAFVELVGKRRWPKPGAHTTGATMDSLAGQNADECLAQLTKQLAIRGAMM